MDRVVVFQDYNGEIGIKIPVSLVGVMLDALTSARDNPIYYTDGLDDEWTVLSNLVYDFERILRM